jgi:hypothetical protein
VPPPNSDLEPLYPFEAENTDAYIPPDAKPGSKPKKKRPFSVPSLFLPVMDRTPKGRASGSAGAWSAGTAAAEAGSGVSTGSGSGATSATWPRRAGPAGTGASLSVTALARAPRVALVLAGSRLVEGVSLEVVSDAAEAESVAGAANATAVPPTMAAPIPSVTAPAPSQA